MQSGPVTRKIYVTYILTVRRPGEPEGCTGAYIWELVKLPYGVTEAGRQWAMVMETWLTIEMEMESVEGVSQLFIKGRSD